MGALLRCSAQGDALKIRWPQGRGGSSPPRGTTTEAIASEEGGPAMRMTILACLAGVAFAAAGDEPSLQESLRVTSAERAPLNLLLTQSELRSVVRNYEERTGEILTAPINDDDEVVVTAESERAPMRDRSQDVMGGIAAPFWAL